MLATIFQRLGDLVNSDQAVERALQNREISAGQRAEIRALMGRNAKNQWEQSWANLTEVNVAQKSALASPYLEQSFELYRTGFIEDRNHFYSGLNALAMVTMLTELAQAQPSVWEDSFDTRDEAAQKLQKFKELRTDLAADDARHHLNRSRRRSKARDQNPGLFRGLLESLGNSDRVEASGFAAYRQE